MRREKHNSPLSSLCLFLRCGFSALFSFLSWKTHLDVFVFVEIVATIVVYWIQIPVKLRTETYYADANKIDTFLKYKFSSWSKSFCMLLKIFLQTLASRQMWKVSDRILPIFLNFPKTSQSSPSDMNMPHFYTHTRCSFQCHLDFLWAFQFTNIHNVFSFQISVPNKLS